MWLFGNWVVGPPKSQDFKKSRKTSKQTKIPLMVTDHLQCQWQGLTHPKKKTICLWHIILVIKCRLRNLYFYIVIVMLKNTNKYVNLNMTNNFNNLPVMCQDVWCPLLRIPALNKCPVLNIPAWTKYLVLKMPAWTERSQILLL